MTWNLEACRNQLFLKKSHLLDFCYMIIKNDFFFQVKETTDDKTDEPSDVISSTAENSEKEPSDNAATTPKSAEDEKNPLGGAIVASEKDKEDISPSKVEKSNEASTSE